MDTSMDTTINLAFLRSDRFRWKMLQTDAELSLLLRLQGHRLMPVRSTCRLGVELSIATIRDWLENPDQWRAIQSRPYSQWSAWLFPLPSKDPVVQEAIAAMRTTIHHIQAALDSRKTAGWERSSAEAVAWHMRLEDQLEALRDWIARHPPRSPGGRRKGSVGRFSSLEEAFDYVLALIFQREAKGLRVGEQDIADWLDQERPIWRTKGDDRDPRSTVRWLQRLRKANGLASWNEVIQVARTSQKKLRS
jgi:hypothetical protein